MKSAQEHPQIVTRYLQDEAQRSRIVEIGSTEAARSLNIQCSPFGVIPKKNKPKKWRLIIDLSSPENHSVNDGILKELASLSYTSIDDVVTAVLKMGKETMWTCSRHLEIFQSTHFQQWQTRWPGSCIREESGGWTIT